ncbi:hypothetical protein T484DRAFT_1823120 [Baffinella frigidus]|nr:hypothetical protein T484DRAFT_1823120 [Cryptophyta sp. CCMP2293]
MRGAAARTAAVLLCFSLLGTGAGSLDPPPPAGALCGLVPAVLVHRSTALRLRGAGPARTTEENEGRHPLVEDWTSEEEASSIDKPTFDVTNPMDAMYMRRFGMLDDQPDRGEDPWDSEAERVLGELRGELDRYGQELGVLVNDSEAEREDANFPGRLGLWMKGHMGYHEWTLEEALVDMREHDLVLSDSGEEDKDFAVRKVAREMPTFTPDQLTTDMAGCWAEWDAAWNNMAGCWAEWDAAAGRKGGPCSYRTKVDRALPSYLRPLELDVMDIKNRRDRFHAKQMRQAVYDYGATEEGGGALLGQLKAEMAAGRVTGGDDPGKSEVRAMIDQVGEEELHAVLDRALYNAEVHGRRETLPLPDWVYKPPKKTESWASKRALAMADDALDPTLSGCEKVDKAWEALERADVSLQDALQEARDDQARGGAPPDDTREVWTMKQLKEWAAKGDRGEVDPEERFTGWIKNDKYEDDSDQIIIEGYQPSVLGR